MCPENFHCLPLYLISNSEITWIFLGLVALIVLFRMVRWLLSYVPFF